MGGDEAGDLAELGAVVPRHDIPVVARREAAVEALEVGVRGGQVEHLHLAEACEVAAGDLAELGAVVVRHDIPVVTRREAADEALEVGVGGSQVEHLRVRVRGPATLVLVTSDGGGGRGEG